MINKCSKINSLLPITKIYERKTILLKNYLKKGHCEFNTKYPETIIND